MDQVISRLIAVDKQARAVVGAAQQALETTYNGMEKEKEQYQQGYRNKAEARIEKIRVEEQQVECQAKDRINARYDQLEQKLESIWGARHAQWEDALFDRTLGGDDRA